MRKHPVAFSLFLFLFLHAPTAQAQYRLGVKAGVQLSDMQYQGTSDIFFYSVVHQRKSTPKLSFAAGAVVLYDLKKNLTLSAEVQLGGRGYGAEAPDSLKDFRSFDAWLWYLQVPLTCNVRWQGFSFGAGPYMALGLSGKSRTIFEQSQEQSQTTRYGNNSSGDYRRLDAGLCVQVGYSFRNIQLSVSYQLGLTNSIPKYFTDVFDVSSKHRVVNVSAAYFFGVRE